MAMFKAFKPSGMEKIARAMGYQGNMQGFEDYLAQDPVRQQRMQGFQQQAMRMAEGGTVPTEMKDVSTQRLSTPGLPTGAAVQVQPVATAGEQFLQRGTGEVGTAPTATSTVAPTATAIPAQEVAASKVEATQSAGAINEALDTVQAAQVNPEDPRSKVIAAESTASSVGDLDAAQGNAILMDNPVQRQIQDGELISGVADATTAARFTEEIQAAQATPTKQATVQGQLETLMTQFEDGKTPAWAAGAVRAAQNMLVKRGLGASSVAGQAIIQAAMESALPIAQADAQTMATFESQNLTNRQQRAMLAAQQRANFLNIEFDQAFQARVQNAAKISDIANQNFTAEQQVALENSRIANTINLQNLSNKQAIVMAEAAALSQLELSSLNNRQQAAVQNAQNFMQRDMANLTNQQQAEMFAAQQRTASIFTDTAAENAARQFNATSENQTNQFFATQANLMSQYNASQENAMSQFNAGEANALNKFNAEMQNQRDQFNASNQLVIAQSNAQWRREIATIDTAAVNRANEINAKAVLDISNQAYANLWSLYQDTMEWAWTTADNELDRKNKLAVQMLINEGSIDQANLAKGSATSAAFGSFLSSVVGGFF